MYNVTVPSLETIISREVLWQSTVTLKIATANKHATDFAVNYGVTDALARFPLHNLVTTMTATINNNTISQNVMDTLPILLRTVGSEEFAKHDCMTQTALDYLIRALTDNRVPSSEATLTPTQGKEFIRA